MPSVAARLPSQEDLPYSDDKVMESDVHAMQGPFLKETLQNYWKDRNDFFIGIDMFVYFSPNQMKTHDFNGPDFFVAQGVKPGTRKSYLLWEEGKAPDVVIEILSESTQFNDKGHKKQVYQDVLCIPEYFWCDPDSDEFVGWELKRGIYRQIKPNSDGSIPCKRLDLTLTRWQGVYNGSDANWLRWATPKGILLPTGIELSEMEKRRASRNELRVREEHKRADEERKRADEERKRADEGDKRANEERKRADALAELLKKHGINPNP